LSELSISILIGDFYLQIYVLNSIFDCGVFSSAWNSLLNKVTLAFVVSPAQGEAVQVEVDKSLIDRYSLFVHCTNFIAVADQ